MPFRLSFSLGLASLLLACSGSPGDVAAGDAPVLSPVDAGDAAQAATDGASASEADLADVAMADAALDPSADAPLASPAACPAGLITAPGACYAVLPTAAGASAAGQNSGNASIALTPDPAVTARSQLLLFFNGSGGKPADDVATPAVNFYDTAARLGYAVLAVSYRSDETIARQCVPAGAVAASDGCYFPSRETIIRGVYQPGAAGDLADMVVDEGIAARTLLTLRYLAALDPAGGWDAFFTTGAAGASPESQLVWSKMVTAGHSQGGGHAAAVGKLFPVARVIQLSATCDETEGGAPASWTSASATRWASDPTQFWGLDTATVFTNRTPTGGDVTCSAHLAVWNNLEMVPAHQNDGAIVCGHAASAHGASVSCPDNAAAWKTMLQ